MLRLKDRVGRAVMTVLQIMLELLVLLGVAAAITAAFGTSYVWRQEAKRRYDTIVQLKDWLAENDIPRERAQLEWKRNRGKGSKWYLYWEVDVRGTGEWFLSMHSRYPDSPAESIWPVIAKQLSAARGRYFGSPDATGK